MPLVVASFVSFAVSFTEPLTRSAAPPLRITTASLGCDSGKTGVTDVLPIVSIRSGHPVASRNFLTRVSKNETTEIFASPRCGRHSELSVKSIIFLQAKRAVFRAVDFAGRRKPCPRQAPFSGGPGTKKRERCRATLFFAPGDLLGTFQSFEKYLAEGEITPVPRRRRPGRDKKPGRPG